MSEMQSNESKALRETGFCAKCGMAKEADVHFWHREYVNYSNKKTRRIFKNVSDYVPSYSAVEVDKLLDEQRELYEIHALALREKDVEFRDLNKFLKVVEQDKQRVIEVKDEEIQRLTKATKFAGEQTAKLMERVAKLADDSVLVEKVAETIYNFSPVLGKPYCKVGEQLKVESYRPIAKKVLREVTGLLRGEK